MRLGIAALVLALAPWQAVAEPDDLIVTALPRNTYVPAYVVLVERQSVLFVQAEAGRIHDLVSTDGDEYGNPLFSTETLAFGGSQRVAGLESVEPGLYPFTCSVHEEMYGQIIVQPAPAAP